MLNEAVLIRSFSQADFDQFALLSGDDNAIHTDPEYSARTHFGQTVAHGLLLCSVLRGLVDQLIPGGSIAEQSVMFPAPTFTNERMRFSAEIQDTEAALTILKLEVRRVADGEIACQGNCEVTT